MIFSGVVQPGSPVSDDKHADGGLGGSSTASYNISGTDGNNAGKGGNGGNCSGGNIYTGCGNATAGTFPGGGGGGYSYPNCNNGRIKSPRSARNGGGGQVIIYF